MTHRPFLVPAAAGRLRLLRTVFLVLILAPIGLAAAFEAGLLERDDSTAVAALKALRTDYQLPALAVGQGQPGIFAVDVVGVRKEGNPKPALTTDIYHLGSNTKAMTATVLALLIQDGHLDWTTTLGEALPGFKISSAHHGTTIELLTSHRSGITDDWASNLTFVRSLYDMSAIAGRWVVSNHTLAKPPSKKLGSYNYANANYILAGLVIDVVTKKPAEEVLSSRIFKPLGITSAGFGPCPEQSDTSIENPWPHYATPSGPVPYSTVPNKFRDNPPALNTAGRVHIAPRDYNLWLQLHLAGAMSPEATNKLNLNGASYIKLHQAYPDSDVSSPGYGYTYGGWLRRNYTGEDSKYTLIHDGSNKLNFAVALIDNLANAAWMALTNVGGDKAQVATVGAVLAMRNGTIVLSL